MATGLLGIPDPGIWGAYVLCAAAVVLCVGYALWRGRRSGAPTQD